MLILDFIEQRRLPDGTPLETKSLDKLSEAALELIYCTLNGGYVDFAETRLKAAFIGALEINDLAEKIAGLVNKESMSVGQKRLINAFLCLYEALQDTETQSGYDSAKNLRRFITSIKDASPVLFSLRDNPMIGEMTYSLVSYLQMYRDYGLVPPASLTPAVVQHLRDQDLVDKERLATVRFYGNISLTVCPPESLLAAFEEGRKRPEMEGIEGWLERTLEIFNSADAIAITARTSKHLSRVMKAAMAAYLLYDIVRTSLGWILKRYERNTVEAPADIYRERQVAEENRAWIGEMLEFSGHRLIATPVTHLANQVVLTGQIPDIDVLRELLNSGTYLIPVYPDLLRGLWDEVLDRVYENLKGNAMELPDFCEKLEQGMRARFAEVFEDSSFAKVALRLQEKWWTSVATELRS